MQKTLIDPSQRFLNAKPEFLNKLNRHNIKRIIGPKCVTSPFGFITAQVGGNQHTGYPEGKLHMDGLALPTRADMEQRVKGLQVLTGKYHDAGVDEVYCYMGLWTLSGVMAEADGYGMWTFWANWDNFKEFIGPRPLTGPTAWLCRDKQGYPTTSKIYLLAPPYYKTDKDQQYYRYAACINQPGWRHYHQAMIRLMAECSFDGVFLDNCLTNECYCNECQCQAWLDTGKDLLASDAGSVWASTWRRHNLASYLSTLVDSLFGKVTFHVIANTAGDSVWSVAPVVDAVTVEVQQWYDLGGWPVLSKAGGEVLRIVHPTEYTKDSEHVMMCEQAEVERYDGCGWAWREPFSTPWE